MNRYYSGSCRLHVEARGWIWYSAIERGQYQCIGFVIGPPVLSLKSTYREWSRYGLKGEDGRAGSEELFELHRELFGLGFSLSLWFFER